MKRFEQSSIERNTGIMWGTWPKPGSRNYIFISINSYIEIKQHIQDNKIS